MSAGRHLASFFIAVGLVFFTVMMPIVNKTHRPGNAAMMVVNGVHQKGTGTSVNTMVNILQFLYIQVHSNHVTQRTYRSTAIKYAMLKIGR